MRNIFYQKFSVLVKIKTTSFAGIKFKLKYLTWNCFPYDKLSFRHRVNTESTTQQFSVYRLRGLSKAQIKRKLPAIFSSEFRNPNNLSYIR